MSNEDYSSHNTNKVNTIMVNYDKQSKCTVNTDRNNKGY